MIEIFGFDHYDEEQSLLQMYYFFDCLNLKEPKYVMENLNEERKEFCKTNKIDEKLKNIENKDKLTGDQAVGYHLPSSYVKKTENLKLYQIAF